MQVPRIADKSSASDNLTIKQHMFQRLWPLTGFDVPCQHVPVGDRVVHFSVGKETLVVIDATDRVYIHGVIAPGHSTSALTLVDHLPVFSSP